MPADRPVKLWPGGVWRHPEFLKLWLGTMVSALGSAVTHLALPLTAITMLGATPAQMGFLGAFGWAPYLLFGLGVAPLGALLGGALGEALGLRATLLVGGLIMVATFVSAWASPLRSLREAPGAGAEFG